MDSRAFSALVRRVLRLMFLTMSGLFLLFTIVFALQTFVFLHRSTRTSGVVTSLYPMRSDENATGEVKDFSSYAPIFKFSAESGQEFTVISTSGSYPPRFAVGQKVPVLYEKSNPANARIASFGQLWGLVLGMGIASAVTGIGGAILATVERKRKPIQPIATA